ncbi:MAG: AmmeMemoRadiSam system radical SAM enzyme [Candidatus Omnitrophica bacterium]|nr:AmmeMemoRadiSam system radical SAM enzyme [Candidatus Omnitrophota bacterium]
MKKVKCLLCPRGCELKEGERGNCRSRMNINGKLQTLVYGKPCTAHVDPIEKKPFYHFLPGTLSFSLATAGCNMHCLYCQNWEISQSNPEDTVNIDMSPEQVVSEAIKNKCRTIACTYSEPIIFFEYAADIADIAHKNNLLNIWVTAGYINQKPLEDACKFLDAVKVDFKGITENFYQNVTGGSIGPVMNSIKLIKEKGIWLELVNLVVPTYNDTKDDFSKLCDWVVGNLGPDVPMHFSKFWPIYQLKNLPPTPEESLILARNIAMSKGMNYVYVGNIPEHEGNNTYCQACKKLIIERLGYTVTQNYIVDSKCKFCSNKIPGRWE